MAAVLCFTKCCMLENIYCLSKIWFPWEIINIYHGFLLCGSSTTVTLLIISSTSQSQQKVLEIGGGRWWWCVCKSTHDRRVWGCAPPEKFLKLGALRSLLSPYLYPNATSPTRYTSVVTRHFSHYSQPCTCRAWWGGHCIDDLDKNSFYFVLLIETSFSDHPLQKQSQRSSNTLRGWGWGGGGTMRQNLFKGGGTYLWCPPPGSTAYASTQLVCTPVSQSENKSTLLLSFEIKIVLR